ncbi:MAG: glycoside hydrolase family 10 protein [Armatimonadota bacterium]
MVSKIVPSPRNGRAPFGVWIHGLHHAKDRDEMRRMVERMVNNGVDILFPCVKQVSGETDYPSKLAQRSEWSVGRDPLQELAEVSKEFGLKVHAWFCNFPEGKDSNLIKSNPELRAIQNHPVKGLQSEKPDMWGESLLWSCSNRPEVIDYQASLMEEVIDNYDVEGVHFDWVRSGFYQCYCKYCQEKCKELTGADLLKEMGNFHPLARIWYGFRAENVTSLVRRVAASAHTKGMETSAAVFCPFPLSYNEQAQEWPLWLKEGYLDLALPMSYTTIPKETHYYTINHTALHRDAGNGELWEGVCSHRIEGELLSTIARTALEAGSPGLVLFDYPDLTDEKFAAIREGMASANLALAK